MPTTDRPQGLSPRQQQILACIEESTTHRGYPPTYSEIAHAVGLNSSSTVQYHLKRLEERGHLTIDPNRARGRQIAPSSKTLAQVNDLPDTACHLITAPAKTPPGPVRILQIMLSPALSHALSNGAQLTVEQAPHPDADPVGHATILGRVTGVTHPV